MMKYFTFLVIFFVVMAFVFPLSVFFVMNQSPTDEEGKKEKDSGRQISVFMSEENKIVTMPIEEYLCGVVSAEMPAEFEEEALKAQAVAARSYAMYRVENPSNEHTGAAVCTDHTHCKAYKTKEQAQKDWGDDNKKYSDKIEKAVIETSGEVITYDGEVALAVFHSQSAGGRTESSAQVWGGEVPYLVSVESHGEELAPNFYSTVEISFDEFCKTIISQNSVAKITSEKDIGEPIMSDGGNVKSIVIGGVTFSGKDVRAMFNLRSSCFKISANGGKVSFLVMGYGHGVGMSQYGANAMAKEGCNYKEILTHYYTGTKIEVV